MYVNTRAEGRQDRVTETLLKALDLADKPEISPMVCVKRGISAGEAAGLRHRGCLTPLEGELEYE